MELRRGIQVRFAKVMEKESIADESVAAARESWKHMSTTLHYVKSHLSTAAGSLHSENKAAAHADHHK
jgi:hypothetical protein